jgi:hypothetical protein
MFRLLFSSPLQLNTTEKITFLGICSFASFPPSIELKQYVKYQKDGHVQVKCVRVMDSSAFLLRQ